MSSLMDNVRLAADIARSIPAYIGLRRFRVFITTINWTGSVVGEGTSTTSEIELLSNGQYPRVKEIESNVLFQSAGSYDKQDIEIGPLTKSYNVSEEILMNGGYNTTFDGYLSYPSSGTNEIYLRVNDIDNNSNSYYDIVKTDDITTVTIKITGRKRAATGLQP